MPRPPVVVALLISSACLTTVEQRWCDSATPCSAGFVCTDTFHCIPAPRGVVTDAGTGGGSGGGGGGVTGGGLGGGGGGATCQATCAGCCLDGRCIPTASQSDVTCGLRGAACRSCAPDERCLQGECAFTPVTDAGVPLPGSPCTSDFQCGADGLGQCIPDEAGFPGGYCTRDCEFDACPAGARCVAAQGGPDEVFFLCLATCRTPAECRAGYSCEFFDDDGLCLPE